MRSISCGEDFTAVFDALDAAMQQALALDVEVLTTPEYLAMLKRCEVLRRRLPALEHPMVNALAGAEESELGGKVASALAERLHITRAEASRRVADAAALGPRRALTGEPLQPVLPATAAAQRDGHIGEAHVRVIRGFVHQLPDFVDAGTRHQAEALLAEHGGHFRPDQLHTLAHTLADCLNPDGNFTDDDRARRRTLNLGRQHPDGMSPITGWLSPHARATLDAVLARWAAPGMCNPDDDTACVSGTPTQDAIASDTRSAAQRHHDALTALGRAMLASGDLGQHHGLPATIIVSTTLADLEAATGTATTGAGTRLPMSDVIRLASHAHQLVESGPGGRGLQPCSSRRWPAPLDAHLSPEWVDSVVTCVRSSPQRGVA